MHYLFTARTPKRGMTLHELAENMEKVKKLADDMTPWGQQIHVETNADGTIEQFEVEV